MASLGILIPILTLMLDSSRIEQQFPFIHNLLVRLGKPTQMELVAYCMIFLVTFYLIKSVFLAYLSWRQGKITANLTVELSNKLYENYLKQPYLFHLQRNSAELFRNINTEVIQFVGIIYNILSIIIDVSAAFGIVILLFYKEPIGSLMVSFLLLFFAFLFYWLTKKKLAKWGEIRQKHSSILYKHLLQGLSGVKDVKLLGRERYFLEAFSVHNLKTAEVSRKNATLSAIPRLYFEFIAVLGLATVVLVMVFENKPIGLFIPTIGLFVAAAFRILPSITRILNSIQLIKIARSAVDLLYNEFNLTTNNIKATTNELIQYQSSISLSDICFTYPNAHSPTISNITMKIKRGFMIGIIGSSGSGKSTLIDLMLGLINPSSGFIKIDDIKLTDYNIRSWQKNIGYVPQTIFLTDDSLLKNIAFGIPEDQINLNSVHESLKAAQLLDFVQDLPEGINTFVGERGVRLSGGQRQRIGIARALYNNPSILVLDEATSALDNETENQVMSSISALHGKITIIIVAHRLTTLRNCDEIFQIQNGILIKKGTPVELL